MRRRERNKRKFLKFDGDRVLVGILEEKEK